jgi:hypothetical protein
VSIVRKALDEPLRWIAQNAGHDGYVVVGKVRDLDWGHGLDAATDSYVDLAAAGIIDPVKVTRNAVANAVSIAGLLITTESLVVEKPKEPEARRGRLATATATATSTAPASEPTQRARRLEGGAPFAYARPLPQTSSILELWLALRGSAVCATTTPRSREGRGRGGLADGRGARRRMGE